MAQAFREEQIGPYRLVARLGEGGMGTVFRAVHTRTGQEVALKTLQRVREGLSRGLRREVQALARLSHPGIVRVLDEGEHQGVPYYAMESIQGRTLRRWREALLADAEVPADATWVESAVTRSLYTATDAPAETPTQIRRAGRGLPPHALPAVLGMVRQLCGALAFLHGEGLLHCDLKPENVIVRDNGSPVLVDFGLALAVSDPGESRERLAVEAALSGTAAYMAPEQIQGAPLDARVDLYALGVILYELLTGERPFQAETPLALMRLHLVAPAPALSSALPWAPAGLARVVARLLEKQRALRPGFASDIARELVTLGAPDEALAGPPPRPFLFRPSFTGREELVTALRTSIDRLARGEGGLLLVGGESGAGKTRLAAEVSLAYARRRGVVLAGECQKRAAKNPLEPLRKILQDIEDHCIARGPAETARIFGARARLLAPYKTSLLGLPGVLSLPAPAELPADAAKRRLFAALGEVLYAYSEDRPVLVVIDDLQWADALTLDFLRTVAAGGPLARQLLVLGAYRTEEVSDGLGVLLGALSAPPLVLARLRDEDVSRMVCDMLALSPAPRGLCQALAEHSEGNPFFVAEYLRAAVEEGLLRRDEDGRWCLDAQALESRRYEDISLPRSVRALVDRRVAGLPEEARWVLERQAVLGRSSPAALLAATGPTPASALQELSRRCILEEEPPGVWRFVHDKLREFCYQQMPARRRALLHREAARAVEALYPNETQEEVLAVLAVHWERAQEPARAWPYYFRAARRAATLYSYQEAEALYRAGLALAPDGVEVIQARNELGEKVLYLQGRMEEARAAHLIAREAARARKDAPREAESARLLGVALWRLGAHEEAERAYTEALFLAEQCGDLAQQGLCWRNLASLFHEQGRIELARPRYERALALHRAARDLRQEGTCLANLAVLFHDQGKRAEARDLYEQALALHRATGSLRSEGICLGNLAGLWRELGHLEEALRCQAQALALARQVGDRRVEGLCLSNLAVLQRAQGQRTAARENLVAAHELQRELANHAEEGRCLYEMAELSCEEGALDQAEALCAAAGEALSRTRDLLKRGHLCCVRGRLALARGEPVGHLVDEVEAILAAVGAGPESELGMRWSALQAEVSARA